MQRQLNPVDKSGERNLFCIYYNECLDHAVKNHWKDWSCFECLHKRQTQPGVEGPFTTPESCLYYKIPETIFHKILL